MLNQARRNISAQRFASRRHPAPSKNRHERRKPAPKHRQHIPFLEELKQIEDPDAALCHFHESQQSGVKHDYPSYSALIYKLAKARKFDAVKSLLNRISETSTRCEESLFVGVIQHYAKALLFHEAIHIFRQIPRFNCTRTLKSFNALLNALVDGGQITKATELFEQSTKMGFRPNSISFNIIIKGHCENEDKEQGWENAGKVFDEMLRREIASTVVTYNILIGFLCKKGDLDKAMRLFEEMIKKGKHPTAISYALLMEGLCLKGRYTDAKKLMFDMDYRGCKPGIVNYGVLMTDLGKKGDLEELKALFAEMKRRHYKPDVVIYNIMINYWCKEGRVAGAYKVLVEMQLQGCDPNSATYRMMIDGFCRAGDFDGALGILNAMMKSKHCPRVQSFNSLVMGLCGCGKVKDAYLVLEEMERKKMVVDSESWEVLIRSACVENGCNRVLDELIAVSEHSQVDLRGTSNFL